MPALAGWLFQLRQEVQRHAGRERTPRFRSGTGVLLAHAAQLISDDELFVLEDCIADFVEARAAYDVWRLRQQVFVVEQECAYPDLDGRDPEPGTRHVLLTDDGELVGYARVLDDATTWRIGRVLLAPAARGRGLAERGRRTPRGALGSQRRRARERLRARSGDEAAR